ncbi:hypothetical protein MNBD_ALPHA12-893 [hydrothermal vent metagenome]|uniref:Uncharacterized protein n=1 Tax=hydrothermal vent metagenome TaxID=652676 RepID=A0A3B0TN72_9ZZZZ
MKFSSVNIAELIKPARNGARGAKLSVLPAKDGLLLLICP